MTQVKQEDHPSDSDGDEGSDDDNNEEGVENTDNKTEVATVEKQRLDAYKKHQKASSKKGSYEPPGIANPLLNCLEEDAE